MTQQTLKELSEPLSDFGKVFLLDCILEAVDSTGHEELVDNFKSIIQQVVTAETGK